jgi:hypothetical protein
MVSTCCKNYDEKTYCNILHINMLDLREEMIIKILNNLKFESIVNLLPSKLESIDIINQFFLLM